MLKQKVNHRWAALSERWGRSRMISMAWFLGVGLTALLIHLLFVTGLDHSALLYMLVPYGISVVIIWFRKYTAPQTVTQKYGRHLVSTMAVFLGSSIILREGFICVIFFLPIYLLVISISFLFSIMAEKKSNRSSKQYVTLLPLLVVAMSLEGTIEPLTFPRENSVQVSQITSLSAAQIKENMARPFDLNGERHWMISIFPMPYKIEAGSLNAGDIHRSYTRYHRWFVTNTHEGFSKLLIKSVTDRYVKTEVLSDTTYFSSYLKIRGSEITLTPLDTGGTRIDLRINYQRKLDPAWYFHPLQKFGVSKMAELLIREVMTREH